MSIDPNNPTGTTTPASGTAAQAAGGSAAGAGGSGGALTREQLEERLAAAEAKAADEARKNAQHLSERSNVERERRELEAERARLAAGGTTPAAPSNADPYAAEIADLQATLAQYPNDTATKVALRAAMRERDQHYANAAWEYALSQVRALSESDDVKRQVVAALQSGGYNTVQAALDAVKARQATTGAEAERKRIAELEEENKRLRRLAENVDLDTSGMGGVPAEGRRKISRAEHDRVMSRAGQGNRAFDSAADKLQDEIDSGSVVIE